jgi:hypothetical protein
VVQRDARDTIADPVRELRRRAAVLGRLLDEDGRVSRWPKRFAHKLIVLEHVAAHFDPGERLSEMELNARLNELHAFHDAAVLRRWLVEYGLFARTRDGSAYWLEATEVDPAVREPK